MLRNTRITKWHLTILLALMALRSDGRSVGAGGGGRRRVVLVVDHFLHLFLLVTTPCDLTQGGDSSLPLAPDSLDGAFPWLVAFLLVSISLLADPPNINSSG
jgi:hypothetical protein